MFIIETLVGKDLKILLKKKKLINAYVELDLYYKIENI